MTKLTVICREDGYEHVLIYAVEVKDPDDFNEVQAAVQAERNADLGDDTESEVNILFAFDGDIPPSRDWRD